MPHKSHSVGQSPEAALPQSDHFETLISNETCQLHHDGRWPIACKVLHRCGKAISSDDPGKGGEHFR